MNRLILLIIALWLLLAVAPLQAQTPPTRITLTPASGPVGSRVTLSGTIDVPNAPFIVYWRGHIDGIKLVKGETGGPHSHPLAFSVTFTIPEDHYGPHPIYILPLGGREAITAPRFSITPTLSLNPTSGTPGSKVTVTGKGFAKLDTVQITFDGAVIKDNITANSLGTFIIDITIPEATAGAHIIRAFSPKVPAEEVSPLSIDVKPVLTVTPAVAEIGKPITITGKGFGGERIITLRYGGNVIVPEPTPLRTNAIGSFTATFTLPPGASLKPTIAATDTAGNTASFDLTILLEKQPPPPPMPLSPAGRVNWFGSETVTFTWTKVTDPSGVFYTIEVAKDLAFFPLFLRRSGLTGTEFTTEDRLPPGTYYWRIKAVDGAGNESRWVMAPHSFTVGFFPLWSLFLSGVIGAIIALWLVIRLIVGFYNWLKGMFYY